jgi:hypothetical protein
MVSQTLCEIMEIHLDNTKNEASSLPTRHSYARAYLYARDFTEIKWAYSCRLRVVCSSVRRPNSTYTGWKVEHRSPGHRVRRRREAKCWTRIECTRPGQRLRRRRIAKCWTRIECGSRQWGNSKDWENFKRRKIRRERINKGRKGEKRGKRGEDREGVE